MSTTEDTKVVLTASKGNTELSKLISNYSPIWDREELKAAYFLIDNMKGRYSYGGETMDNFAGFFKIN